MEEATVPRRRWFSRQELLDMIAACQLIPGPTSTELALHIGQRRAGLAGLLVAGGCFIFPAAVVTLALAWCYVRYGRMPAAEAVLAGVKPVMIAVVAEALFSLGGAALRSLGLVAVGALALAAAVAGVNEILVLLAGGLWCCCRAPALARAPGGRAGAARPARADRHRPRAGRRRTRRPRASPRAVRRVPEDRWPAVRQRLCAAGLPARRAGGAAALAGRTTAAGRGQHRPADAGPAVHHRHLHRVPAGRAVRGGAATAGIFCPVRAGGAGGPLLPRLRRSPLAAGSWTGVNAAALALMALVAFQLARTAVVDRFTAALAIAAALALRLGVRPTG
jgi:chromate transporter